MLLDICILLQMILKYTNIHLFIETIYFNHRKKNIKTDQMHKFLPFENLYFKNQYFFLHPMNLLLILFSTTNSLPHFELII
jgi:hypothetical protein